MENVDLVDLTKATLLIKNDNSVHSGEIEPWASSDSKGMTVGLATMEGSAPHNGERHNDGDEIIIVVSGKITIESDSNPASCLELRSGDSCIIRKGEWHKVNVIEKAQLVYITPSFNNEHRF
ncbi:cupin domain-containing protein [Thalassotalea fusca]